MYNDFFENDSNGYGIDDEIDDVHGYDENGDSENDDIAALECDITEGEVYETIRMLKNGKAAGLELIIGEFFKNSATHVFPFLVRYFNKLFSSGLYPDNWSEAIIQPLFKKGDPEISDNYRGISLLSICSKLYSYILNKRLTCWIDDNNLLSETQAGFRKTYSTTDHLFTLLALIQKQLLCHKKLYVAFIDFRKAFDSVIRTKLWAILRRNGLKGKMY